MIFVIVLEVLHTSICTDTAGQVMVLVHLLNYYISNCIGYYNLKGN